MSAQERVAAARRWETGVRDPAQANAEPARELRAGKARARWQVAPIPGGWAWRASAEIFGDTYAGTPWVGPVPTRAAAEAAALAHVDRFLTEHAQPAAQGGLW